MRHERLMDPDTGDMPLKLIPLQRKADSFNDVVWDDVLPSGPPRVVLFDLNFQETWSATLLQTALRIVGDQGPVLLLSSATTVAESWSMNAREQSMLKSIDFKSVSVIRLLLSWQDGQTGFLTVILNHTDLDHIQQHGSPLLTRLISCLKSMKPSIPNLHGQGHHRQGPCAFSWAAKPCCLQVLV